MVQIFDLITPTEGAVASSEETEVDRVTEMSVIDCLDHRVLIGDSLEVRVSSETTVV